MIDKDYEYDYYDNIVHDDLESEPEFELAKAWIHRPRNWLPNYPPMKATVTSYGKGRRRRRSEEEEAEEKKWTLGPKPSFVRNKIKECSVRYIKTCETLFDKAWMTECRIFSDISNMIEVSYRI